MMTNTQKLLYEKMKNWCPRASCILSDRCFDCHEKVSISFGDKKQTHTPHTHNKTKQNNHKDNAE